MPDLALDLRYLRYAILVAQHGSFRAAAESMNLSQSTVSRRIQVLEKRLGATLFERGPTGVRLTAAGQRFIQDATISTGQLLAAIEEMRGTHRGEIGEIRIGLMISLTTGFLAELIRDFRGSSPRVEVRVQEVTSDCATIQLLSGGLDVAFLPMVDKVSGCDAVRLWEERLYCAVSRGHRLAAREAIGWKDIKDELFLLPAGEAGAELDEYFLRRLSGDERTLRRSQQSVGRENLLNMVGDGFGVSLVLSSATGMEHSQVAFLPLQEVDETVAFSVVWAQKNKNPVVRRLVDRAIEKAGGASRSRSQSF